MRNARWGALLLLLSCGETSTAGGDTHTTDSATETSATAGEEESSSGGEPRPNYAFVTSRDFGFDFEGAGSATGFCRELAESANLPGTYVAWFPDSENLAHERLQGARGWVRVDGKPFADTAEDIRDGRIWYPLNVDEWGERKDVLSTTGTSSDGSRGEDCNAVDFMGTLGESDSVGRSWTEAEVRSCDSIAHFYCFGTDYEFPVEAEVQEGRRAFVSSNPVPGNAGIEAFDDECMASAQGAGLQGSFLALVALSDRHAMERFDAQPPWTNTLGQRLSESAEAIEMGHLLDTGIGTFAGGSRAAVQVWTGAFTPSRSATQNCEDWSRDVGSAEVTRSGKTARWFSVSNLDGSCDEARHVYCLEE